MAGRASCSAVKKENLPPCSYCILDQNLQVLCHPDRVLIIEATKIRSRFFASSQIVGEVKQPRISEFPSDCLTPANKSLPSCANNAARGSSSFSSCSWWPLSLSLSLSLGSVTGSRHSIKVFPRSGDDRPLHCRLQSSLSPVPTLCKSATPPENLSKI